MEQQGEGLEVWSDAAGEDADAVAWDEGQDATAWDERQDATAWDEGQAATAWDEGEDAVAWDQGESDALDPDGQGGLDPDGPPGQRPATGEPRVDAALARLDELAGRPVTEHRAVFEDVHRRLRDVLGELDTREQSSGDPAVAAGAERRASS
jgi:hypothetical protein